MIGTWTSLSETRIRVSERRVHVEAGFCHFNVKAAELVPGEVVEYSRGVGVVVVFEGLRDIMGNGREAGEEPAVFEQ